MQVATAVIPSGWREVDLPVLWQRRPRSVVQEEAGRALPNLLQAALRFSSTQSEGRAHVQGEGCEVARPVEVELGGLFDDRAQRPKGSARMHQH
jgi:hypothetical protein